jgi:hypothetical protein
MGMGRAKFLHALIFSHNNMAIIILIIGHNFFLESSRIRILGILDKEERG